MLPTLIIDDTQHNDNQHNDTQHYGLIYDFSGHDTRHNWHSSLPQSTIMPSVIMVSVAFNLLFYKVLLCWGSLCWMPLCWGLWRLIFYNVKHLRLQSKISFYAENNIKICFRSIGFYNEADVLKSSSILIYYNRVQCICTQMRCYGAA